MRLLRLLLLVFLTVITVGLYPLMLIVFRLVKSALSKVPTSATPELVEDVADKDENIWGTRSAFTSACPYCGEIQDPPPKRKKKCRDCGRIIRPVKRGGRRQLLTEDAYAQLIRRDNRAHARRNVNARRADLRRMHSIGIDRVEVHTCNDERVCAHCRSLHGRVFDTQDVLRRDPLSRCESEYCRSIYVAVIK